VAVRRLIHYHLEQCDLATPACTQCVKSNWTCPGYDTGSRFVAYNQTPESRAVKGYRRKSYSSSTSSFDTSSSSSDGVLTPSSNSTGRIQRPRSITVFPVSAADSLRNEFIFKFNFNALVARMMVVSEKHILQQIPVRIGQSPALDDAVKCICGASQLAKDTCTSSPRYAKALQSLQQALQRTEGSVASETMAAALLLQMHEHSVSHTEFAWVAHANGVVKMLELRGPNRIKGALELAIFKAQVGNIFIHAVQNRTECFLAEPEWHSLLTSGNIGMSNTAMSAMIDFGIYMPGIVRDYEIYKAGYPLTASTSIWQPDFSLDGSQSNLQRLHDRVKTTRRSALEWCEEYASTDAEDAAFSDGRLARIKHSTQLSLRIFLMLLEFIAADITQQITETLERRLRDLALRARSDLSALMDADELAAFNTSWLMRALVGRVLEASCCDAELDLLREPVYELMSTLDACQIQSDP
jgi:hypothetical protein